MGASPDRDGAARHPYPGGSAEAHGRFLIEQETKRQPLETCGELHDDYAEMPAPDVSVETIESYQGSRGRRSGRP